MIPIRDVSRRTFRFPIVTTSIIALNALVYLVELAGGDAFIYRWSMIPANITAGQNWITVVTSLFLHSGWAHIIGNMLFLWVFGPEVEDAMRPLPYLVFYLLGGLAAAAAQILVAPHSLVPVLGASGAIAAVMGAFLIMYPRDRIKTLVFLGWFVRVTFIPAALLVGFWFLTQLFNQVGALATMQTSGVAYMAHIGGFLFGAAAVRLFDRRPKISDYPWDS